MMIQSDVDKSEFGLTRAKCGMKMHKILPLNNEDQDNVSEKKETHLFSATDLF